MRHPKYTMVDGVRKVVLEDIKRIHNSNAISYVNSEVDHIFSGTQELHVEVAGFFAKEYEKPHKALPFLGSVELLRDLNVLLPTFLDVHKKVHLEKEKPTVQDLMDALPAEERNVLIAETKQFTCFLSKLLDYCLIPMYQVYDRMRNPNYLVISSSPLIELAMSQLNKMQFSPLEREFPLLGYGGGYQIDRYSHNIASIEIKDIRYD